MNEQIETAAGAEAERRWPVVGEHGSTFTYPLDALRESRRAAFTLGAAWQAAQPRTVSQTKFADLCFVADLAFLTAPAGTTDAGRLRAALVAVLGGLGYTVEPEAGEAR
jgi:hypothetical protein